MNKFPWKFSNRASRLTWQLKMFACDIKFICIQLLKTVRGGGREREKRNGLLLSDRKTFYSTDNEHYHFVDFMVACRFYCLDNILHFKKMVWTNKPLASVKRKYSFFCRSIVTQICLKSVHPGRLFAI